MKPERFIRITDSVELNFEPTVEDLRIASDNLYQKHMSVVNREQFDKLTSLEVRAPRWYDNGTFVLALCFSHVAPNQNYETEFAIYETELAHQRLVEAEEKRVKAERDSALNARKIWKDYSRQERVTRKALGRHLSVSH